MVEKSDGSNMTLNMSCIKKVCKTSLMLMQALAKLTTLN